MKKSSHPLPEDVLAEIRRGNTLEAIKRLRRQTGASLKEAKQAVDGHVHMTSTSMPLGDLQSLPALVRAAIDMGRKIDAIRLMRDQTGLGLKDAKAAVEGYKAESSIRGGELSPGEVPRPVFGFWRVIVLAVLVLILYRVFGP